MLRTIGTIAAAALLIAQPLKSRPPPPEDAVSARRPSGGSGGPRRLAQRAEESVARGRIRMAGAGGSGPSLRRPESMDRRPLAGSEVAQGMVLGASPPQRLSHLIMQALPAHGMVCNRSGASRCDGPMERTPQATFSFIGLSGPASFDPHCFTKSQLLQNLVQLRR